MPLLAGQKTVASAATPEPLAASTASISVVVQAKQINTQSILLGTNSTPGGNFQLAGNANFVATADDTLTVIRRGTVWHEVGRSVN